MAIEQFDQFNDTAINRSLGFWLLCSAGSFWNPSLTEKQLLFAAKLNPGLPWIP
jgi:hypothetical protein